MIRNHRTEWLTDSDSFLGEKSGGEMTNELLHISWDDQDAIYVATVPLWPGCVTHATTLFALLINLRDAMEAWLASKRGCGDVRFDGRPLRLFDALGGEWV